MSDAAPDFGPTVAPGVPRRRAVRPSYPLRERTTSHPDGTLVAHLSEHTGAITSFAVSPDHVFFASGSSDGTVKVWDSVRLDRNAASRSRHTYRHGAAVTSVCMLEHSHCVASASIDGALMVHRVDVSLSDAMPKYAKSQLVRSYTLDRPGDYITCMTHMNTPTASILVFGTSSSTIVRLDLRTMRVLSTYDQPVHLGAITSLCYGDERKRVWLVVGTSLGYLTLWDLRFGLLLRTWRVGGTASRVRQIVLHPVSGRSRCVIVAADYDRGIVLEMWDVETAELVERFVRRSADDDTTDERAVVANGIVSHRQSAAEAIDALLDHPTSSVTSSSPPSPAARVVVAGLDFATRTSSPSGPVGLHAPAELVEASSSTSATSAPVPRAFVITGGEDRKLRYWDLERIEGSVVFSGHNDTSAHARYQSSGKKPLEHAEIIDEDGRPSRAPHRVTQIAQHQQQLLRSHHDAITALALVDLPFRCVLSGARDGSIKVYT